MNHQVSVRSETAQQLQHMVVLAALIILVAVISPRLASAQKKGAAGKKPAAELKSQDETLTTRDGVQLRCTYFPGPESKQTVPIILVHDWDSQRGELYPLAVYLQRMDYAVIVPDLRGHGNSVHVAGVEEPLDYRKFRRTAIEASLLDIEAVKTFLLKENNAGKLNIEQLGVLGTGFGASLALNWAIRDWSVQNLPTYKMGQDVKALVLVSPVRSFKGVTINMALRDLRILSHMSVLVAVGSEDSSAMSDAQRIHKAFDRAWGGDHPAEVRLFEANTSLQGFPLISTPGTGVDRAIAAFLDQRLKQQSDRFPWTDRTSPLK